MRQPEDSGLLEAALRLVLARRRVPSYLRGRVMDAVRAESARGPARSAPAVRFAWPLPRVAWTLGTCAAVGIAGVVLLVGPQRQDRVDAEATALHGAELELAEALQLAGLKWNKAQEAALSPIQENRDD